VSEQSVSPRTPPESSASLGFAAELQRLLDARGWTGTRLAREADISPTTIQKYRRGEWIPKPGHLERIITALALPDETAIIWRRLQTAQPHARHPRNAHATAQQVGALDPSGFHAELYRIAQARPGGMRRLAWDAGLSQPTIPRWLRTEHCPQPETLEALLTVLDLPPEQSDRWRAEVATWWEGRRRGRATPPGRTRAPKVYKRWCAGCDQTFISRHPEQKSCSQPCEDRLHALARRDSLDNDLKRLVQQKLRAVGLTPAAASRALGWPNGAVSDWLTTPGRFLTRRLLGPLATWLQVDIEEAIRLQGGTGEEQQLEAVRRASTEDRRAWARAFWTSPAHKGARARWRAGRHGARGAPKSPEHRAKIAAANQARYAQTPKPAPTFRARVLGTRAHFRRHHPDWSPEEVEEQTIARLTERWGLPDPRIAWVLLHVKLAKRPRRGPRPDNDLHDFIRDRFAAAGRGPWETPRGFFTSAHQALLAAGLDSPGAPSLERYWRLHLVRPDRGTGCLACAEHQAYMSRGVS
jgi:transcriptional regulator with XRE-family HTH domain